MFFKGNYFVIDDYNYKRRHGSIWLDCSHVRNKYFYLEISALWYILSILTENYTKTMICVCAWNMRVDLLQNINALY